MGLLLLASAFAGPVPIFGANLPPPGAGPTRLYIVVADRSAPGTVPNAPGPSLPEEGWELPTGPKPRAKRSEPTFWQSRPTVVENPGTFVPVEELGSSVVPMEPVRNVLEP